LRIDHGGSTAKEVWQLDHTARKTQFSPVTSAVPHSTLGAAPVNKDSSACFNFLFVL
jgi:hypothetical protein